MPNCARKFSRAQTHKRNRYTNFDFMKIYIFGLTFPWECPCDILHASVNKAGFLYLHVRLISSRLSKQRKPAKVDSHAWEKNSLCFDFTLV